MYEGGCTRTFTQCGVAKPNHISDSRYKSAPAKFRSEVIIKKEGEHCSVCNVTMRRCTGLLVVVVVVYPIKYTNGT